MKLQVLQENLTKALSHASRFASSKAQLPVLGNILFAAKKSKLVIASTNLEISVSIFVGAKIEKEGSLTVPSRVVSELISNLSTGALDLEAEKEILKIHSENFQSKIAGINASDFPSVPQSINEETALNLPGLVLSEALSQVLFATSIDETRPLLTGVLFIFSKEALVLVATDGFRLSQKKISLKSKEPFKIILPKNILGEISKLSLEEDLLFSFSKANSQAVFAADNLILSSRILEGEFPDFEKIIPKETAIKIWAEKEDFLRAVKLASVFARESANIVKIKIKKDGLEFSAESQTSGDQSSRIEAKIANNSPEASFEIAFNYRFLEDFLHAIQGEEVEIHFSNSASPGVFLDPKDPDYLHLIMPVKIQT